MADITDNVLLEVLQKFDVSFPAVPIRTALPSYDDVNIKVTDEGGASYVLKVSNATTSRDTLEVENAVIRWLTEHMGTEQPQTPRLVQAKGTGEHVVTALDPVRYCRLITWVDGVTLSRRVEDNKGCLTTALLRDVGSAVGRVNRCLNPTPGPAFTHPCSVRKGYQWDLRNFLGLRRLLPLLPAGSLEADLVADIFDTYERDVLPCCHRLRTGVAYNDPNECNVLTEGDKVSALIDFGDANTTYLIADVAIAAESCMLLCADTQDPVQVAAEVTLGFHTVQPLTTVELECAYHLMRARAATTILCALEATAANPDNREYLMVSYAPAVRLLTRLKDVHPRFAHYMLRHACGLSPCPGTEAALRELQAASVANIVDVDLSLHGNKLFFPLSPKDVEPTVWADVPQATKDIFGAMEAQGKDVGIGFYGETRVVYTDPVNYGTGFEHNGVPEARCVHLGIDVFLPAGSPVYVPLDGYIHSFADNANDLDYGPCIVVRHPLSGGGHYHTLYGHLSRESLEGLYVGRPFTKGEQVATIGDFPINGNWPPHLHFQIVMDMFSKLGDFDGASTPRTRDVYFSVVPNPNVLLRMPEAEYQIPRDMQTGDVGPEPSVADSEHIVDFRRTHFVESMSLSYRKPLKMVRGLGSYLYDAEGHQYLDCVNNVCHVGHCHPRVVAAATEQMATLNTNTRYLHDNIVQYAKKLLSYFPDELNCVHFTCTGSEANDLALRMARAHTKHKGIVCLDMGYHGHTQALVEASPYKHNGKGGEGPGPHVRMTELPDPLMGKHRGDNAADLYAQDVLRCVQDLKGSDHGLSCFLAEMAMGVGGQVIPPDGYYRAAYQHVRDAGGLCIADEVQSGFGRVGSPHMWFFQKHGVVPDIVTLGKGIGNGHPMAAVITRRDIASSFGTTGMEYFNTFGGNPVSMAVGLAVLQVVEEERLVDHAARVGAEILAGMAALQQRFPDHIANSRGSGLFIGLEIVKDGEPCGADASEVVERCCQEHRVLLSTDGRHCNVLKVKPPLVFNSDNARQLLATLGTVMAAMW